MEDKWFIVQTDNDPIESEKIKVPDNVTIKDSTKFCVGAKRTGIGDFSVQLVVLSNPSGKEEDLVIEFDDLITRRVIEDLAIPAWIILREGVEYAMTLCVRERVKKLEISKKNYPDLKITLVMENNWDYSTTIKRKRLENALDFSQEFE